MRAKSVEQKNKIYFWERIAFRISVGFILPVLMSAYALSSVSGVFAEVSASKEKIQRTWNSVHLNESKALLTLAKMRMNALHLAKDPDPELAKRLEAGARDFLLEMEQSRRGLEGIAAENGMQLEIPITKSYASLRELHKGMLEDVNRLIEASRRQNTAEADAARKRMEAAAANAESLIAKLRARNDLLEQKLAERVEEGEQRGNRTLHFYLIAVFVFGILAAALVTYSIIYPVKQLMMRIQDIATGDGDLTKRVSLRGGGEMSELGFWLNLFLDKTHDIISTIANASSVVSQTTDQVGKQSSSMTVAASGINKAMMEQSMNIDECTGRVSNIDDLIQNSGESTRQAASLSKIAMDRALQGGASVHETVEAMEKIEESARKVEELMSSINEIASQTNLLAINAAIEATKAGEHGKGFAVVAEEVRKLAERARKLTAEVTALIGESNGRVKAGVGLARAAGVSLDGIIKDVEAVSSLIQRIASAATKQTESSTVVLEFMQRVSESVRHNLTEMEGVTKSAELTTIEVTKLDALVGQLNQVVGQFRLSADGAMLSAPDEPPQMPSQEPGSRTPGDLSFEAMMNPVPQAIPGVPAAPAVPPPPRGFAPLPEGANPVAEGEEDAA